MSATARLNWGCTEGLQEVVKLTVPSFSGVAGESCLARAAECGRARVMRKRRWHVRMAVLSWVVFLE
jgi:hypothetical protein